MRVYLATGLHKIALMLRPIANNLIDADDWSLLTEMRPNVLLCGDPSVVEGVLMALLPQCRRPIHKVPAGTAHVWSWACSSGTVILHGVSTYTIAEQRILDSWIENRGESLQFISTADQSVRELVARGAFFERLFYHLNTMYFDLGCPSDRSH